MHQFLTKFQKKVYNIVRRIPKGKVATYQSVARFLGNKNLARSVGKALNKNPFLIKIPCHRVVKFDGSLGGYRLGIRRKKELLISEGIKFIGNKIDKKYIIKIFN